MSEEERAPLVGEDVTARAEVGTVPAASSQELPDTAMEGLGKYGAVPGDRTSTDTLGGSRVLLPQEKAETT